MPIASPIAAYLLSVKYPKLVNPLDKLNTVIKVPPIKSTESKILSFINSFPSASSSLIRPFHL